jgi:iron complex outermembrane recepter protein
MQIGIVFIRGVSTAALVASTAGIAAAQTPMPAAEQAQSVDGTMPGEIIVTAQRRNERLQDIPISLAVVQGSTLQTRSVQTFEQLAPLVPNLAITKTPGASIIYLRGIGTAPGSPSLDQSVVMIIDGIYAGNVRQFSAPFLDIERMEVLRGPQGALIGRNTSAGAINITTKKPGPDFGGYLLANYDFSFNGPTVEGAVDVPVSDAVKVRVAGKYARVGGYIFNSLVDEKQPKRREYAVRATVVVDNGGPVKITAKYENAFAKVIGQPIQAIAPDKGEFLDYEKSTALPADLGQEYDRVRTNNAVLQADIDLGGPSLVSITGYSQFSQLQPIDADFFFGNFAFTVFGQNFHQYSQELRLASPSKSRLEYIIGGYASVADLTEIRSSGVLFAPAASNYRTFKQEDKVLSAYGQATYHLTDSLKVTASLRYTYDKKSGDYVQLNGPLSALQQIGTVTRGFRQNIKKGFLDPSASIQYNVNPNVMLYARYGHGSKVGGFQGAVSDALASAYSFKPEQSNAYEVGTKATLRGLGYVSLALFRTDYRDLQVTTPIAAAPGSLVAIFFTGNAPKARTQGIESEFSLKLNRWFFLDGSLAWLPTAKYVDFPNGPCYVQQLPNGSGVGSCDKTGLRLGFAPRYSGSVTATVEVPVGGDLSLKGSLSPIFQGRAFRDFTNDPVSIQDSFLKLDARLALASAHDRWELAVIGKNLTNRRTLAYSSAGGLANTFLSPSARVGIIDPPREVMLQARLQF